MRVPLEITFRGMEGNAFLEDLIREKAARLDQLCDNITSCRVAVENRHQHQRSGQPFRVRIDMKVPRGHEIVVSKDSTKGDIHDPLNAVLKDAFDAAGRQLKAVVEKQRGDIKHHPDQRIGGIISSIFRDEGYGFLKNLEGRDIYFHKNSVLYDDFERLEVGTGVRYVEEEGDKGPQATTVQIVDKPSAFS